MKNFERVRAKLGRDDNGYAYCDIESTDGVFILKLVGTNKDDDFESVFWSALNCLSEQDWRRIGEAA